MHAAFEKLCSRSSVRTARSLSFGRTVWCEWARRIAHDSVGRFAWPIEQARVEAVGTLYAPGPGEAQARTCTRTSPRGTEDRFCDWAMRALGACSCMRVSYCGPGVGTPGAQPLIAQSYVRRGVLPM